AGLARGLDYLRAYPERSVLLFAVEIPSLTFQPDDQSIDNLVASLVFADGAGAAVLRAGEGRPGWTLEQCGTVLVPEGACHLAVWCRQSRQRVERRHLLRARGDAAGRNRGAGAGHRLWAGPVDRACADAADDVSPPRYGLILLLFGAQRGIELLYSARNERAIRMREPRAPQASEATFRW